MNVWQLYYCNNFFNKLWECETGRISQIQWTANFWAIASHLINLYYYFTWTGQEKRQYKPRSLSPILLYQGHIGTWTKYLSAKVTYHQTSNVSCTSVSNKLVDHSDVVGASPVGAAPTSSSFSTGFNGLGKDNFKMSRAHSRFAPRQWKTLLQSNAVSHWLGANLAWGLDEMRNMEVLGFGVPSERFDSNSYASALDHSFCCGLFNIHLDDDLCEGR